MYLRLAGLPTLKVVPCPLVSEVAGAGRGGATALKYFEIEEVAPERAALERRQLVVPRRQTSAPASCGECLWRAGRPSHLGATKTTAACGIPWAWRRSAFEMLSRSAEVD